MRPHESTCGSDLQLEINSDSRASKATISPILKDYPQNRIEPGRRRAMTNSQPFTEVDHSTTPHRSNLSGLPSCRSLFYAANGYRSLLFHILIAGGPAIAAKLQLALASKAALRYCANGPTPTSQFLSCAINCKGLQGFRAQKKSDSRF